MGKMGKTLRWTVLLGVAGLTAGVAVSCAAPRTPGGPISRNEVPSRYLQCADVTSPQEAERPIGPDGGNVVIPNGSGIRFEPGALTAPMRTVRVRQLTGRDVGYHLTITPNANQFPQQVVVFVSLAGCTPQQVGDTAQWSIFRKTNPSHSTPGDRLHTGRDGNRLWAITDRHSFIIVAD
jgi:hypothetical protein